MLLTLDPNQAYEIVKSPQLIREDRVIPGHFRPSTKSPYEKGFDWIYRYECKIAQFLDPFLKSHVNELIGPKGLLHEALYNAFHHAHHKDTLKQITVNVLLGRKGLIIQISDCGNGFNVQKVYKDYVNNRRFFTSVGKGIRMMDTSDHFGIFYNRKGTQFHLLHLFENDLAELSAEMILSSTHQKLNPNVA